MFCLDADDIQALIKKLQKQILDKKLSRSNERSLPWLTLRHCCWMKMFCL